MSEGRENHLLWCKARAFSYLDDGRLADAVASMMSDMSKRKDTTVHPALGMMGILLCSKSDVDGIRKWIEGFR